MYNQYPSILYKLTDEKQRHKLLAICTSLDKHNVLKDIYYGSHGATFKRVKQLLDATALSHLPNIG